MYFCHIFKSLGNADFLYTRVCLLMNANHSNTAKMTSERQKQTFLEVDVILTPIYADINIYYLREQQQHLKSKNVEPKWKQFDMKRDKIYTGQP